MGREIKVQVKLFFKDGCVDNTIGGEGNVEVEKHAVSCSFAERPLERFEVRGQEELVIGTERLYFFLEFFKA